MARHRIEDLHVTELDYDTDLSINPQTTVRLICAGHVFGSAMIHVTCGDQTLLYTGDFKLRESLTAGRAKPIHADTLVMECTFGLPAFRFPPVAAGGQPTARTSRAGLRRRAPADRHGL